MSGPAPRVVVTGVNGRLGAALVRRFRQRGWPVTALDRTGCDLRDRNRVRKALADLEFDWLFHPAAMTSLEACEDRPEEATLVNGESPGWLAEACRERRARMVHFSTDYVFSGTEPGLRTEEEPALPVNHYGRTKLLGERATLERGDSHWVVRVSWLFGPDRPCFVDEILGRARRGETLAAVADKFSSPTLVDDLIDWLDRLMALPKGGVVHACNRGSASWHDYAEEILRLAAPGLSPVKRLSLAEMKSFRAERPRFTAMSTAKLSALTGVQPRDWRDALAEFLAARSTAS